MKTYILIIVISLTAIFGISANHHNTKPVSTTVSTPAPTGGIGTALSMEIGPALSITK